MTKENRTVDMSSMVDRLVNVTVKAKTESAYWRLIGWLNEQPNEGIEDIECHSVYVTDVISTIETVRKLIHNSCAQANELNELKRQVLLTLELMDTKDAQRKITEAPLPYILMDISTYNELSNESKNSVTKAAGDYRWSNCGSIKASVEGFIYQVAKQFYINADKFTSEEKELNLHYLDELESYSNGLNDSILIDELISHVKNNM